MSSQNDPKNNDEMQLAEELDELLTVQMAEGNVPIRHEFSSSEAEVAAMLGILVDSAKELQPNPDFTSELETRLLGTNVVEASEMFQDAEESPKVVKPSKLKSSFLPSRRFRRFSFAAIVLLSISSVVIASTPSLRSFAQSIFENFIRTDSDMVGNKPTKNTGKRPPLTEKQKQDMKEVEKVNQRMEVERRTTSTIAEMEAERGYDLKEPAFIPAGYVLHKEVESIFSDMVMFGYKNPQNNSRIAINQKRLGGEKIIGPILQMPSEEYKSKSRMSILWFPLKQRYTVFGSKDPALQQVDKSPVGASAKIELVQIGQFTGEYVEGAWDSIDYQGSLHGMKWNQNAPLRQIQWKEGNMLYQIASTNELSRDELVAIARSMK
ncbi:MAG: hypothetical protein AAF915_04250 [Cyanobacteria bacterium P01_D01_bin.50]